MDAASLNNCVILDLLNVRYLESRPIGVLVKIHRDLAAREGAMALVCCEENVKRLFEISGVAGHFAVFDRLEDAVSYVTPYCRNESLM